MELTSRIVKKYASEMADHFGAHIHRIGLSRRSDFNEFFDGLSTPSASRRGFLDRYAFTIGTQIYLPYTPGYPRKGWSLQAQIENIAHECMHVHQFNANHSFDLFYLSNRSFRANAEAQALCANMELYWMLNGKIPAVIHFSRHLTEYGLRTTDIRVVNKHLAAYARMVRRGMIGSPAGKESKRILTDCGLL